MSTRRKQVSVALDKLELSRPVRKALLQIWDEIEAAHRERWAAAEKLCSAALRWFDGGDPVDRTKLEKAADEWRKWKGEG